jgi:hypothetical protein
MSRPSQQPYDFIITARQKSFRGIDLVGYILYLLAILFFLRFFIEKAYKSIPDITAALLMLVLLVWKIRERRHKKTIYFRGGLALTAIALFVFHLSFWYMALLYLLAALFESYAKTPLELGFSKEEIIVNSLPRKRFSWQQVKNVVLKDELLTIDLRNNRLIQQYTEPYNNGLEKEFNDFCRQNLG